MTRMQQAALLVAASTLTIAPEAAAVNWPVDVSGQVCWNNAPDCFNAAWRLFANGDVLSIYGPRGTWSWANGQLVMDFIVDEDGDGVLDYSWQFVGAPDAAAGCVVGTVVDNLNNATGTWHACP